MMLYRFLIINEILKICPCVVNRQAEQLTSTLSGPGKPSGKEFWSNKIAIDKRVMEPNKPIITNNGVQ